MSSEPSFLRSTLSRAVTSPLKLYHYLRPSSHSSNPSPTPSPRVSSAAFSAPSPLTYLTSSYLLLSLSLAFLLHRIHHLVPPSHRPSPVTAHGQRRTREQERVESGIVQIGIRLPGILFLLKTSAALYLAYSGATSIQSQGKWMQWGLRGLQASTRFCGKGELGRFISSSSSSSSTTILNHSQLLWQTFLSISTSITLETFVRALSDDTPSLHSFNLLSFSFLLHVQSHPSTSTSLSSNGATGGGNGGNEQLYLYLLLTNLELVALQSSYLLPYLPSSFPFSSRSRPTTSRTTTTTKRYRFPITMVFSFVSQFLAIRSYYLLWTSLSTPVPSSSSPPSQHLQGGEVGLIWFNKLPELFFTSLILLSLGLKLVASLIRGEELSRENLVGAPVWWDFEEDYGVVLIKYTTALLRSTRLSHLSFELSPLSVLPSTLAASLESIGFDLSTTTNNVSTSSSDSTGEGGGGGEGEGGLRVRLERNGDVLLMEELETDERAVGGLRRRNGRTTEALEYGFGTEIKQVEIEPLTLGRNEFEGGGEWEGSWGDDGFARGDGVEYVSSGGGGGGREGGDVGMGLIQGERRGYMFRLLAVVLRMGFYVIYIVLREGTKALKFGLRKMGLRSLEGRLRDTWTTSERSERRRNRSRSRGIEENEGEDEEEEDGDYAPSEGESDSEDSGSENEMEGESAQREEEENALALISDLSTSLDETETQLSPSDLAPYLLAHHLSPSSSSTLTRRRYASLFPSPSPSSSSEPISSLSHLDRAITSSLVSNERLMRLTPEERETKRQEWRDSRSSFCVVCTVEPRTVILWPCRCLALCESCREALALRTTAATPGDGHAGGGGPGAGTGGNLCPTCRGAVAGYSRIVSFLFPSTKGFQFEE
ncbi:uncharacterized protein JCM6883_005453 [Sporobolomyces salmoneus]|uniref:uncharacterized protein n=1 Tax=Sporobolomyces salmoneus TaxID=183962 RepID=UPI00318266A0